MFPRRRPAVLVSRGPPLSGPPALAPVAAAPLPDPGGLAEHPPVGPPDVLRSRAVSLLHDGPAAGRAVRAGRPVGGRRPDVGPGVGGVSPAAVLGRRRVPVRPARRQGDKETRRQGDKETRRQGYGIGWGADSPSSGAIAAYFRLLVSLSPCLLVSLRSAARPAGGPVPALAARASRPPAADGRPGRRGHPGRAARAAGRRHEPRRRPAVDPLARLRGAGPARGGQRVLHGVPVHAAADARPPLAAARVELAAPAAKQVGGGRLCWDCSSGPTRPSPCGTAPGGPRGSP